MHVATEHDVVAKVDLNEVNTVGDDTTSVGVHLKLKPESCPILAVVLAPRPTYLVHISIGVVLGR